MTPNPTLRARDWAQAAIDRCVASGRNILLSLSVPISPLADPLALFERASGNETHCFLWQHPPELLSIVALGSAAICEAEGASRFARLGEACADVLDNAVIESMGAPEPAGPLFVGGFSFDDRARPTGKLKGFPAGKLLLPRLHIVQR